MWYPMSDPQELVKSSFGCILQVRWISWASEVFTALVSRAFHNTVLVARPAATLKRPTMSGG